MERFEDLITGEGEMLRRRRETEEARTRTFEKAFAAWVAKTDEELDTIRPWTAEDV